jgi:hypothetical protein
MSLGTGTAKRVDVLCHLPPAKSLSVQDFFDKRSTVEGECGGSSESIKPARELMNDCALPNEKHREKQTRDAKPSEKHVRTNK